MTDEIQKVEEYRTALEVALNQLLNQIGTIQISPSSNFPYGWRKAAKGRTVWRLLEELITQNLESKHHTLGIHSFSAANSEVGVYDFICSLDGQQRIFVNIKSAVKGERVNKDDISKARALEEFFSADLDRVLLIATFELEFLSNMMLRLKKCTVVPVMWLPDIYVNPSNNGNLQSSKYKNLAESVRRKSVDFLEILRREIDLADDKREAKRRKKIN